MSTKIGEIDGYDGTIVVAEYCGPHMLADMPCNKDRMCLQVDDDLRLDRDDATQLRDMLTRWLGDAPKPVDRRPRLVRMPWGAWVPRHAWARIGKGVPMLDGDGEGVEVYPVDIRFGKDTESSSGTDYEEALKLADKCAAILNGTSE